MLRRLLAVYVSLLVMVLAALEIPLAVTFAAHETQAMFIDRLNDTSRFASLAEPALCSGRTDSLRAELVRYDELYGIPAAVADREGNIVVASRPGLVREVGRSRLRAVLSGDRSAIQSVTWPWNHDPMIVVEPVGCGGEVIGAAVTVSPTHAVRASVVERWSQLAAAGLAALLVFGAAAIPLSRWVLRVVRNLDRVTGELSAGRLQARVPVATGPAELRRLAEHFNAMAEAMSRNLELQRSFASYASHQLRNPLAALRLRVENLGPHMSADGARDLESAIEETARLTGILDGLLALVRAEGGNCRVAVVDCGRVATERVAAWREAAAGVRVRRRGAAHAGALAAVDGVGQILDALIDNAAKFAGPGATVTVTVSRPRRRPPPAPGAVPAGEGPAAEQRVVCVDVADDGPGLPDAERAAATQRFWRSPEHQNIDGTGLGLTIAHALAEASGGRLELLPVEPHGLCARLVLPAPAGDVPRARDGQDRAVSPDQPATLDSR
ncbi:sensor histidine kinase [Actinomadura rugatobispora]|uniref:histidine kinase n=1 Tax=Actinomadura rugatobispora TaxID=1994 RepID=A0ABW0ZWA0_9ACTN|nr:HAMP domain-containing sensor histidine kinase [Actinomadura rugatobispora]